MKRFLPALIGAGLVAVSSVAVAEISANVAFTTDYRYRGISQSDEDFALQGGFDYTDDSGFYLGTWASSIDNFSPNPNTGANGAQTEIDFYGGYAFDLNDAWSMDLGALYYYYPGASTVGGQAEIDFLEFYGSLGYETDAYSTSLGVAYSSDFYGETGDAFYYSAGLDIPLPMEVGLGFHVGYQTVDDIEGYLGTGADDYADWSISLSRTIAGLDWSLAYVDTDIDDGICPDLCEAGAVATVSKSF